MGLDYMHRVCKLIHTDLKPENVTFAMSQEEEFDLLYRHVFCTPLIKVYDHRETIAVGKKQLKNQKKKERRKRKKALATTTQQDEGDHSQEEEEEEEEKVLTLDKPPTTTTSVQDISLADKMIADMRRKVAEEDKQYYVMQRRRYRSEDNYGRWFVPGEDPACRPIMDMDQLMSIEEHRYRGRPGAKKKAYMRLSS